MKTKQTGTKAERKSKMKTNIINLLLPKMKSKTLFFLSAVLLATAASALAEVHYVDVNSTNATPPYTNWTTAATNIQDAVDAAVAGDEIVVTNGFYNTGGRIGNRLVVDKPVTVRSVNGPEVTIIRGVGISTRCVLLTNDASLSGFTLAGGRLDHGGGLFCASGAVASNCIITGNTAFIGGGGVSGGTLVNCRVSGNSAGLYFGIRYMFTYGGGAENCTLINCTLATNKAAYGGYSARGGGAYGCELRNCLLVGNSVDAPGSMTDPESGGLGGGAFYCSLWNCTLVGNSGAHFGDATYSGTLNNCTLTGNSTGAFLGTLNNCIVYFNTYANYGYGCVLNFCCTTPQPDNGLGNITNAPLFVDTNGWANLRLQSNSPCINAGNNSYATNATDLDGNPRIAGGTVDIGAYEFQSPASMISYAWLQQFNLPNNPATDAADPDGDGVDNYHEWLAHSDPTNPYSFPPILSLIPDGPKVILTWSTNAVGFTLQSTTNLGSQVWSTNSPAPVVIGGQNVVTNPLLSPQQFYRLSQ